MLPDNFDKIEISDIQSLIDNKVPEGKLIDYKLELHIAKDGEIKEFLYDVTSFANTSGGFLVIGIKEEEAIPTEIAGTGIDNIDTLLQRIESILRDCISPRIAGIGFKPLELEDGKYILVIKIPNSWNSPHQVTFKATDKFYARNNAGKYKLDVFELRQEFNFMEQFERKVKNFITNSISKVISGETPVRLGENGKILLQLIPLNSFKYNSIYDLKRIKQDYDLLQTISSRSVTFQYNFEGYLSFNSLNKEGISGGYVQIHRNGIIEYVDNVLCNDRHGDNLVLPSISYENRVILAIKSAIVIMRDLGVAPPFVISMGILNIRNHRLGVNNGRFYESPTFGRDNLILNEIVVESFDIEVPKLLRNWFDSIWNAAGYEKCYNFDNDGNWKPPNE